MGGIGEYHTRAAWLWLGAWHIIALARSGRIAEAETILQRAAEAIVRDGVVHEVYGPTGAHLSTFWYTSGSAFVLECRYVGYMLIMKWPP
ncbi:MAG: hypothetical protein M5U34_15120 [Chloroflexi bacterium]|nr:hypothetical protein [Chloroflexota bacterium]